MKPIVFIVLFFFIFSETKSQISYHIDFESNDFSFEKNGEYDLISIAGFVSTTQIGAPKLPVIRKNFILPNDAVLTGIEMINHTKISLDGNFYIYPTQPPKIVGEIDTAFVEPDALIYESNTPYPYNQVEVIQDNFMYGYHIVSVVICPFEYIPKDRELNQFTSIELSINYHTSRMETTSSRITQRRQDIIDDYILSIIENPDDFSSNYNSFENRDGETPTQKLQINFDPSASGDVPDFIIITNNNLKPKFEQLAEWKNQTGIPTIIVTTEQIYQNYSGFDNAEKIRNYLKDAYTNWGAGLFVLLGGDTDVIPARRGFGNAINVTDYYYCDVYRPGYPNYNWNQNGDNLFGDGVVLGPENFIGRFPVSNLIEAENLINKVISYEKLSNVSDLSYVIRVLLVGAYHYPGDSPAGQNEWMNPAYTSYIDPKPYLYGFKLYDDYELFGGGQDGEELNRINFLNELNSGAFHIITHYDHGSPYGIGASGKTKGQSIYRTDMDILENNNKYQIMFTAACEPNEFQLEDCFGEHYINSANGGVMFIGNSHVGYRVSHDQLFEFLNSLYNTPDGYFAGIAFQAARDAFTSQFIIQSTTKSLNLLGDPTMKIWTNTPGQLTLTASIQEEEDNKLKAIINQINNEATVTLYKYSEETDEIDVFGTQILAPGETEAVFNISPNTEGNITVTATAKDYIPAAAVVPVIIPGPQLHIIETSFTDENGNGLIEEGETINLSIKLENSGNSSISNISTSLASTDNFADVNPNSVEYSNGIGAGQNQTLSGYSFKVSNTALNLSNLEFSLNITGPDEYAKTEVFYLDVYSPDLILGSRTVGDIIVGENTEVNIKINNAGNIAATELTATLTTNISEIDIGNPTSAYDNIESFGSALNNDPFIFTLNEDYTDPLIFTLTIENEFGKTWTFDFDINDDLPPEITDFGFLGGYDYIDIHWHPATNIRGYDVYRSDDVSGEYSKINNFIIQGTAAYSDLSVSPESKYYYKISVISNTGNEIPIDDIEGHPAWTSLEFQSGFPITSPGTVKDAQGSPNCFDIDGDGKKEIFMNHVVESSNHDGTTIGLTMAFKSDGEELFDIDNSPTDVSGFAYTQASWSAPAIGNIDQEGQAEVIIAARDARKLYCYKTVDTQDDFENKPDLSWTATSPQWPAILREPVIFDYNNDNNLEVVALDEHGEINVFDKDGNQIWSKLVLGEDFNELVSWGGIAVGDMDNDGNTDIVAGFYNEHTELGEIYIFWSRPNNGPDNIFESEKIVELSKQRLDSSPVLADIDSDDDLDILILSKEVYSNSGRLYVFNSNGYPVNDNFNGAYEFTLSGGNVDIPSIAVGDINQDNSLEIVFGSENSLHILNNVGELINRFPIEGNPFSRSPLLADIDIDDDIEVVIALGDNISEVGGIYAYDLNGDACIGWPLTTSKGIAGTPCISDIDDDGQNEIVASSKDCKTYVWKSQGNPDLIEWGSYRHDAQNTGTYRKEPDCVFSEDNDIINTDTEWTTTNLPNNGEITKSTVRVKSGNTLTIGAGVKVHFTDAMIIEPNAKVILHGTLTGCNNMWEGVQVIGNSNEPPTPVNGDYAQGRIECLEGALIEDAITAVALYGDYSNNDDNGGQIYAINATFKNNRYGIVARPYSYYSRARFINCNFITDNDYKDAVSPTFFELTGVKGVGIWGCTFTNNCTTLTGHDYGKGINAINSGFYVGPYCEEAFQLPGGVCPSGWIRSKFRNLGYGILTRNAGDNKPFTVKQSDFVDCYYGIYNNGVTGGTILFNDFYLGDAPDASIAIDQVGIMLEGEMSGFTIQENDFRRSGNEIANTIGIIAKELGAFNNNIRRNDFSGIAYGNLANGQNASYSSDVDEGLYYTCNRNFGNANTVQYDYCVPNTFLPIDNIRKAQSFVDEQGTNNATGNYFSHAGIFESDESDFSNKGGVRLDYYYYPGNPPEVPIYINEEDVRPIQSNSNDCPVEYCEPPCKTKPEIITIKEKYYDHKALLKNLKSEYSELLNGGDTEILKLEIETVASSGVNQLKDKLIGFSPWLSSEILVAVIDRGDVFDNDVILQILSSNPEGANTKEILERCMTKDDPFSAAQMESLKNSLSQSTERKDTERAMTYHKQEMDKSAYTVTIHAMYDTLDYNNDTVRVWLGNLNTVGGDLLLAKNLLMSGEFTKAMTVLDELPDKYNLTAERVDQLENVKTIFEIVNHYTLYSIESSGLDTLRDMAAGDFGYDRNLAQNILSLYGEKYKPVYWLPEPRDGYSYRGEKGEQAGNNGPKIAFPNPASDKVSFRVKKLLNKEGEATIIVTDIFNNVRWKDTFDNYDTEKIWDCGNVMSGTYFYIIYDNNKIITSGNILIEK